MVPVVDCFVKLAGPCDIVRRVCAGLLLALPMDANAPKLAKVEKVLGRTGSRGGVLQVKVTFMAGENNKELAGRSLIRNVGVIG